MEWKQSIADLKCLKNYKMMVLNREMINLTLMKNL